MDEPCIVKENLVQACNQKRGPFCIVEHVMKVSVTREPYALSCIIVETHHDKYPTKGAKPNFSENGRCKLNSKDIN